MKLIEWLGSLMMVVALLEFIPSPRKAFQSIDDVLQTNVVIKGNKLVVSKGQGVAKKKISRQDTQMP